MCNCRSSVSTRCGLALLFGVLGATVDARSQPLALRNLSPLYANLGVPVMASAQLPDAGQWRSTLQFQLASHARRERDGANVLELDGETRRFDISIAYSPSERLQLRWNLPWVNHGGGGLDALIDGWHDLFGLPDGPRDHQPEDRLRFAYGGSGGQWLLDSGRSGLGDMELAADWSLWQRPQSAIGAFASIKLPSGEEEDFAGSGDRALAVGLRVYQAGCVLMHLSCHAQVGLVDIGDSPLDTRAESWTSFYGLSLAWALGDRLSLLAQIEGQSTVYRSAPLDEGGAPLIGAFGARWQATDNWQVEALFSEDLNVGSTPDITFQLGIRHGW